MMVVSPIYSDINETDQIAEQFGDQRFQYRPIVAMWYFNFENHNGDNDSQNAIAECFKSSFIHSSIINVIGSSPKVMGRVLFCVRPFFDADDYDSYD